MEYEKDDGYYAGNREDVLSLIELSNDIKVLDVGCGRGGAGKIIKTNCKAEVHGIDISSRAADEARTYYDSVICGNIETYDMPFEPKYFDLILCSDILEHLSDPWGALRGLKHLLKDDGRLAASIPNIRNADVLAQLIDGSFDYQEYGVLDDTHLRFFTYRSSIRLFERAGFRVDRIEKKINNADSEQIIQIWQHSQVPHYASMLMKKITGKDTNLGNDFLEDLLTVQFLITAVKCEYGPNGSEKKVEAYFNLGNTLKARGDLAGAINSYKKAVQHKGNFAEAYNNLGNALADAGQSKAAIANYRQALSIKPDYGTAYYNLANLLHNDGRAAEAMESYQRAIDCQPDLAGAHTGLGQIHMDRGQFKKAIACFRSAVQIQPDLIEAWNSLGAGCMAIGQPDQAIINYNRALQLMPESAEAHCNLANAFLFLGQFEDAAASCQKALDIQPDLVEAVGCLGDIFYQKGKFDRAIACYQNIIALRPDGAIPYNNLGNAYKNKGNLEKAIACYQKALELEPEFSEAQNNIIEPLQLTCDWKALRLHSARLDASNEKARKKNLRLPEDPFVNITRQADPALNYAVARSWARDLERQGRNLNCRFSYNPRPRQPSKITIGYLSNNFCDHPVAHQMAGLFKLHNRDDFNIFCYSYGMDDGSIYRRRIQQDCDKFVDLLPLKHAASSSRINTDGVDILVDLVGLTNRNRLVISALRPAPIQVSYLGMLGTTGADFFDYVVTDNIVTPGAHQPFYSEKFIYMPHCYQINDSSRRIPTSNRAKGDFGLPPDSFVFCSFNNSYKFEPVMFDSWMRILRRVQGSVLWLARGNSVAAKNLRNEAEKRGVDPQRLVFADRLPLDEHLARLKFADLALDTRIYNGGATTSNALWAAVPVITLLGSHFVSRMSASALAAIGLREMITNSLEEYESLAIELACHPGRLQHLRQKLDGLRWTEPLFDTPRFVKNLETAYRKIWQVYLDGQTPGPIEIVDQANDAR